MFNFDKSVLKVLKEEYLGFDFFCLVLVEEDCLLDFNEVFGEIVFFFVGYWLFVFV